MIDFVRLLADTHFQIDASPLPHATSDAAQTQAILGVVFSVIGVLALLMLTVGGFRYVASQGDPQAANRAKNTIIYALVGLLVSLSAVAIVMFVIGRV